MEIILSRSQGFCAGVAYAVSIVENALRKYGTPIYVYHEIVHNTFVVNDFKGRGVIFVDNLADVPRGQRLIFSAHGVPPAVMEQAKERHLKVIDATCPLVKKVHREAERFSTKHCHVVLIGHRGHQEIIGTSGYVAPELLHIVQNDADIEALKIASDIPVAYLTQTTLSVDETREMIEKLKKKFPQMIGPAQKDICYATQKRQDAVKSLAAQVDLMIVCGSPASSNSNRLRETAARVGTQAIIIDHAGELDLKLLEGKPRIGLSSGASVPRVIVDEVVKKICAQYPQAKVHGDVEGENAVFPVPEI